MRKQKNNIVAIIAFWVIALIFLMVLWHVIIVHNRYPSWSLLQVLAEGLKNFETAPFELVITSSFFQWMFIGLTTVFIAFLYIFFLKRKTMFGREHGSAEWATAKDAKALADKNPDNSMILTNEVAISMNTRKTRLNNNTMAVGGSGSGKTRFVAKPNILQAICSYVITDSKGELLKSTGKILEVEGYDVKVFNLIEMQHSCCYNPFFYIHKQSDVFKLITQLIKNTNPPEKGSSGDPFWEKSEIAILEAIFFYLWMECPKEDQNFKTVMKLLDLATASEEDENQESSLDIMFRQLEEEKGEGHIACKQYKIYKTAAGKTAKSILISVKVRLSVFNLEEIAMLTLSDNISLNTLGNKKTVLYIVIPDADTSFNFIVSMLYSQLFDELYFQADFGGLKWSDNKILYRTKESLSNKKCSLEGIYAEYCKAKGEKKKFRLHKEIRELLQKNEAEFGLPAPEPEKVIKKEFIKSYMGIVDDCLIRLSNKTRTLRKYIDDWEVISYEEMLIKQSKVKAALKVKNLGLLREKKEVLAMRMEGEYGLKRFTNMEYLLYDINAEKKYINKAKVMLKEMNLSASQYGTRQSFDDKLTKIEYLNEEIKKKKKEKKEAAFWQLELKKDIAKKICQLKEDITRIEIIAEYEFGIALKKRKNGGRLPVHVRCILDEFANISPIPDFAKLVATMRSREISVTIILQNLSQIKEMFKDNWESISGNCDTFLFLGGQEQTTLEYVSKKLGKTTIDKRSTGHSKGRQGSSSQNWDTLGRELMTPDEIGKMKEECILFVRGFAPFLNEKYKLERHKRFHLLGDTDNPSDPNLYDFYSKFNTREFAEGINKEQAFMNGEFKRLLDNKIEELIGRLDKDNYLKPLSKEELELFRNKDQISVPISRKEDFQKSIEYAVCDLIKNQQEVIVNATFEEISKLVYNELHPDEEEEDKVD